MNGYRDIPDNISAKRIKELKDYIDSITGFLEKSNRQVAEYKAQMERAQAERREAYDAMRDIEEKNRSFLRKVAESTQRLLGQLEYYSSDSDFGLEVQSITNSLITELRVRGKEIRSSVD